MAIIQNHGVFCVLQDESVPAAFPFFPIEETCGVAGSEIDGICLAAKSFKRAIYCYAEIIFENNASPFGNCQRLIFRHDDIFSDQYSIAIP